MVLISRIKSKFVSFNFDVLDSIELIFVQDYLSFATSNWMIISIDTVGRCVVVHVRGDDDIR